MTALLPEPAAVLSGPLTLARMITKYALYLEEGGVRVDVDHTVEILIQTLREYPYEQAMEAARRISSTSRASFDSRSRSTAFTRARHCRAPPLLFSSSR